VPLDAFHRYPLTSGRELRDDEIVLDDRSHGAAVVR
jgi:hypothetical protein